MRLVVEDLVRHFGPVKAVDGISFSVGAGEIYGFVGPNGAGKTTTLRILATLDEPTSGDARLDGFSVIEHPERARRTIGYMPDHLPTYRDVTVADYLDFFARAYGLRGQERRRVLDGVIDFTRLGGLVGKSCHALSKGMKQRLSLARALVHDPAVLVLDEPAAALDPRARIELRELLRALAEAGKAILISSHILSELAEICHGVVILERGRIVNAGTTDALSAGELAHTAVRLRLLERPAAALAELSEVPGIDAVREAGLEFELEILGGEEACARVLAELVGRGHRVVEFRRRRSGLEDLFMNLTRGEVS